MTGIHGRYSGSTETKIRYDLVKLDGHSSGIKALISDVGELWGHPRVRPVDFDLWSLGARTYPILYWLTRMRGAQNFCDGIQRKDSLLGKDSHLNVHHIFPKAKLYDNYNKSQVNAIGNFCSSPPYVSSTLPSKDPGNSNGHHTCERISDDPRGYFYWTRDKFPDASESQWIPMDEELWKIENYPDFLIARRQLLPISFSNL